MKPKGTSVNYTVTITEVTGLRSHLGKANEEELVVGQVDSRKSLLVSVPLDPRLVGLEDIEEVTVIGSCGGAITTCVHTHVIRRLQPSVVSDVFSERLFPVDVLPVDGVAAVLIHHALRPLTERLHRRVLPPRPQVAFFIVLST